MAGGLGGGDPYGGAGGYSYSSGGYGGPGGGGDADALPKPPAAGGAPRVGPRDNTKPCPKGTYKQGDGTCAAGRDAQAKAGMIPWGEPCPGGHGTPGGLSDPDWCHRNVGASGGGLFGGGGPGGVGGGMRGGGGAPQPRDIPRPNLPPIDPQARFDPNLEAYRDRYLGHITNLETGTGHAMDVLRGQQQDALEADVERARQAAANADIPFNEAEFRAEQARGVNAAMAQEKLGREAMMTQAYTQGLPIIGEPASERFNRLELDLRRDVADSESVLDLYGRDIQKYGIDMQAAVAANNALMSFYSQLMGGMMGGLGNLGGNINYTSNIG